jgi:H+/Cl- antiporter ClcA
MESLVITNPKAPPISASRSARLTLSSRLASIPLWSWAEFIGYGLAGALAGFLGMLVLKMNKGGPFRPENRRELVAAIVMGIVAGSGGVFLTWCFRAAGLR